MSNTTPTMRAKLKISTVTKNEYNQEILKLEGVPKSGGYPADGSDEDNTFAKFSPQVSLEITIANPDLLGKFAPGDFYYLDFVKA